MGNETNSKSNIIIQKENALNYNGNFDKLLSLPVRLKGFESSHLKNERINAYFINTLGGNTAITKSFNSCLSRKCYTYSILVKRRYMQLEKKHIKYIDLSPRFEIMTQ